MRWRLAAVSFAAAMAIAAFAGNASGAAFLCASPIASTQHVVCDREGLSDFDGVLSELYLTATDASATPHARDRTGS